MSRYPRTILGTCCIPWNEKFVFEEQLFRESVRLLLQKGLHDLYIFGTAGEGHAVTESQFDEIVKAFCEEMQHSPAPPMVGLISLSLGTMIERIERCIEWGVRDFQISLPCWGELNDRELRVFFGEICGRFPYCRFLHYNLLRSKRLVTPAEYSALAEAHPNLVATKHGTPDSLVVADLLHKAPQLRHFFTEPGFAYGSLLGECGLLISVASIHPRRAREYFEAGVRRESAKLMEMQQELLEIRRELLAAVGKNAHMDGAYDKVFAKLHDARFPLRLLAPYACCSEEDFAEFEAMLRARFPQWVC